MHAVEHDFPIEDIHPIDIVETLAERRDWSFDRVGEDEIAMAVEGKWRTYSVTLAWRAHEQTLRLMASFEFAPSEERLGEVAWLINQVNDECWSGAFTLWADQGVMVWRYGLTLAGGASPTGAQIETMLRTALMACERFYPAFQLTAFGEEDAEDALAAVVADAIGRA